ncbi:MAG: MCE family protein [Verrucomicrobia bacterium]|nr:MAG: MCE family protein [Verrucomicrobiota bacterium]
MALQDLTPQLRTRLSRVERAVGWFVLLAIGLLVFGFAYYLRHTAERKGWFKTHVPYYTMVDSASGLRVGDPVMMMGFEVGRITEVKPQPPGDRYNVFVQFEIIEPNYGYLWTDGSLARMATADLFKRVLEVTKGTNGYATYQFHPMRRVTIEEAKNLPKLEKWQLAEDIYEGDTNRILRATKGGLSSETITRIAAVGRKDFLVFETTATRKSPTAVWNDQEGRYDFYGRTNIYWLPGDETPALTERAEKLVSQIEKALPGILDLTNKIIAVLTNTAAMTSNINALAAEVRPAASNFALISADLRAPGALGEWLLPTNLNRQLNVTLNNADTNLTALAENFSRTLDHLAGITSNLNAQVQANTNMLKEVSDAVVHADDLVQGLKRHWLLRSAFKTKTNAAPVSPKLVAPRAGELGR